MQVELACHVGPEILDDRLHEFGKRVIPQLDRGQGQFGGQADNLVASELAKPFAVVADFGFFAVENLEDLLKVSLGVGVHLLASGRAHGCEFGCVPRGQ